MDNELDTELDSELDNELDTELDIDFEPTLDDDNLSIPSEVREDSELIPGNFSKEEIQEFRNRRRVLTENNLENQKILEKEFLGTESGKPTTSLMIKESQEISAKTNEVALEKRAEEIQEIKGNSLALGTDDKGRDIYMGKDGVTHSEPRRAKEAFQRYLTMPNRGLQRLAEEIAESTDHHIKSDWNGSVNVQSIFRKLAEYSSNFDWQGRLKAADTEVTAQALVHARKQAAKRRKVRISYFQMMSRAGYRILEVAGLFDPDLSREEAQKMIKQAPQLINMGLQGEKAEISEALAKLIPTTDISDMSDSELAEFIDIVKAEMQ